MHYSQDKYLIAFYNVRQYVRQAWDHQLAGTFYPPWSTRPWMLGKPLSSIPNPLCHLGRRGWVIFGDVLNGTTTRRILMSGDGQSLSGCFPVLE